MAFGDLQKYVRKVCGDFRNLGRWQSMLIYATEEHQTRGSQSFLGLCTSRPYDTFRTMAWTRIPDGCL